MIQRVQTVFLLLAAACMVLACVLTLATLTFNGDVITFEAMGFFLNGQIIFSSWGLFIIGTLSAALSIATVFFYKKRMLQIRLTVINIVLMIGFYLFFIFLIFMRNPEASTSFEKIGGGLIMPLIAIIFSYLAIRKIGEDEMLVRSLNRLRK